jgi:hypothetical protein
MMQPGDPVVSQEELQELGETQWNPAYHNGYHLYAYPHGAHFKHKFHSDVKVALRCWFHPEAWRTKPQEPEKVLDMPTLAVLYEYIQAENTALKLQLASLQCMVNDILMEINTQKPTPTTTSQPEIQVPEAVSAPP